MIYVVTSGEYSDYGIRAIFTSHDLAQEYIEWNNGPEAEYSDDDWHEFRIEEYEENSEVVPDTGAFVCEFVYHEGADAMDYHGGYSHWKPEQVMQLATASVDVVKRVYNVEPSPRLTVVGYGPTSKHATLSAYDTLRAIKAGTLLIDGTTEALINGIIL